MCARYELLDPTIFSPGDLPPPAARSTQKSARRIHLRRPQRHMLQLPGGHDGICTIEGTVENSSSSGVRFEMGAEIKNLHPHAGQPPSTATPSTLLHQVVATRTWKSLATRTLMGHEG